nr:hypothetical protein CFP56_11774 [Quercus suber]
MSSPPAAQQSSSGSWPDGVSRLDRKPPRRLRSTGRQHHFHSYHPPPLLHPGNQSGKLANWRTPASRQRHIATGRSKASGFPTLSLAAVAAGAHAPPCALHRCCAPPDRAIFTFHHGCACAPVSGFYFLSRPLAPNNSHTAASRRTWERRGEWRCLTPLPFDDPAPDAAIGSRLRTRRRPGQSWASPGDVMILNAGRTPSCACTGRRTWHVNSVDLTLITTASFDMIIMTKVQYSSHLKPAVEPLSHPVSLASQIYTVSPPVDPELIFTCSPIPGSRASRSTCRPTKVLNRRRYFRSRRASLEPPRAQSALLPTTLDRSRPLIGDQPASAGHHYRLRLISTSSSARPNPPPLRLIRPTRFPDHAIAAPTLSPSSRTSLTPSNSPVKTPSAHPLPAQPRRPLSAFSAG